MTEYVTYLTIYKGNKMPPFYIGYTSKIKILSGYNGSVVSKEYKQIWKYEQKHNKHLFKTQILKEFVTSDDAILYEEYLHCFFNVDINPMYINKVRSRHHFRNKGGYKLTEEQRNNRKWTEERKIEQSKITTERNKIIWASRSEEEIHRIGRNISAGKTGKESPNKGISRTEEEIIAISLGTRNAMDNTELRRHLSEKAKARGVNKICCIECKKIIPIPMYYQHLEKHDGINRIYINDGKKQIKIRENIDTIPDGYFRGRLKKKR
jgi:hypothetical protein